MKNTKAILAAGLTAFAMLMAGCGKAETSEMHMDMSDEKSAVITLDKSSKDLTATSGTFVVDDGEQLLVEPALEGDSKIQVSFIASPDEGIDQLPDIDGASVMDLDVDGTDTFYCSIEPGSYMLKVTVLNESTGTVTISTEAMETDEYMLFEKVASAEEAAKGAGLDKFVLPMDAETDLGKVADVKDWMNFRYLSDFAQADFPMAAADLVVRKGPSSIDNGDVSGDYMEYAYEWTQDVNGTEAKCWGNKEGAAMKTIWTKGDYCYSITARGAGGEEDFGLSANDVAVWVNGVE